MVSATAVSGSTRRGPYLQVARNAFRRQSTYRAANLGGIASNTVVAVLKASILLAVARTKPVIGGFDARDLVTFAFVSMALDQPVGMFQILPVTLRIRSGDIALDLLKPVDFQGWWFAHDVGRGAFEVVARLAPPLVVGALLFDLRLPATAISVAGFALALVGARLVSFGLRFLVSLCGFWLLDDNGPRTVMNLSAAVLSGWIVPIVLFPAPLEALARWSPFAGLAQLPIEVFLGKHDSWSGMAGVLAFQMAWTAVLFMLGRMVARRALRKVVIQGG